MSAFVVSKTHIDVLVSGALDRLPDLATSHGTADAIGQVLWRENVRSVQHRYPRIAGTPQERSYLFEVETYRHTRIAGITDGQLCKAIDCLDYQSCETDDWSETPAFLILEHLRGELLKRLPGYEKAPWGFEQSHVVAGCLTTEDR